MVYAKVNKALLTTPSVPLSFTVTDVFDVASNISSPLLVGVTDDDGLKLKSELT